MGKSSDQSDSTPSRPVRRDETQRPVNIPDRERFRESVREIVQPVDPLPKGPPPNSKPRQSEDEG